jgi:hypothetical protein
MDACTDDKGIVSTPCLSFLICFLAYLMLLEITFARFGFWYGLDDIANYWIFYQNQTFDVSHWLTVLLFDLMGFSGWISFLSFIFVPFCLFYYFRDVKKTLIAFSCSSYIFWMIMGVYSQILAFCFFLLFLKDYGRKISLFWIFLAVISHPAFISCILLYIFSKKGLKASTILCIIIICIMIYILTYKYYIGYFFFNIGLKIPSYTEPAYWLVFILMNPFLFDFSNRKLDYWLFFLLGIFGHNGRFILFFIPFMVRDYKGRNKIPMIIFGCFMAFMAIIAPFYKLLYI